MISVRPAHPSEGPALQDLNHEVFLDNAQYDPDLILDWPYTDEARQYFQELISNPKSLCLVVENDQGTLIGYIAGNPLDISYRKSSFFEIENMGVLPQYRSQGVGQALVKAFLTEAKTRGFQKVYVNSFFKNEKAIRFYQKCGFEKIDISLEQRI